MSEEPESPASVAQDNLRNKVWGKLADDGWGESVGPSKFVTGFFEKHFNEFGTRPRVVDIGCGAGRHVVYFAEKGSEVTGVEPSEGMRRRTIERLKQQGHTAEIVDGKSDALPFSDKSVDVAVSIGVSHHGLWQNAQKDIAEAARVLKPGGYLLFQVRSVGDTMASREEIPDYGITAIDKDGPKKDVTHHYFTPAELIQLGEENGLEIIEEPKTIIRPDEKDSLKQQARLRVVYKKKA